MQKIFPTKAVNTCEGKMTLLSIFWDQARKWWCSCLLLKGPTRCRAISQPKGRQNKTSWWKASYSKIRLMHIGEVPQKTVWGPPCRVSLLLSPLQNWTHSTAFSANFFHVLVNDVNNFEQVELKLEKNVMNKILAKTLSYTDLSVLKSETIYQVSLTALKNPTHFQPRYENVWRPMHIRRKHSRTVKQLQL